MFMGQFPDPRLMPRSGLHRRIEFLSVHCLYLIRPDPTLVDSNSVIAPFTQGSETVLGSDASVHNVCGIAIKRLIRGWHQLAASHFLHNGHCSCRQLRGGLEEVLIPGNIYLNYFNQFDSLVFGDVKAYSEVQNRLLLHLATNSATLDQAK